MQVMLVLTVGLARTPRQEVGGLMRVRSVRGSRKRQIFSSIREGWQVMTLIGMIPADKLVVKDSSTKEDGRHVCTKNLHCEHSNIVADCCLQSQ